MGRLILTDMEKERREERWLEAYESNGGNAKQAAITAGWKPISASNAGTEMRRKFYGDEKKETDGGYFYVIDLIPEALDLNRLKLGFSSNLEQRLQNHRCAAPTAVILKSWPCKKIWELAAMDALSRGEKQVGHDRSEVFDVLSVSAVLERGDDFFGLMPCPLNGSSC